MSGPSRGLSAGPPSGRLWLTIESACRPFGSFYALYYVLFVLLALAGMWPKPKCLSGNILNPVNHL
jgi:hypothetical protein